MIGKIYVVKNNQNEKVYIGKTFQEIQTRFREHIRDSRKVEKEQRKLYRAIKKYGEDSFYVDLLEDQIDESILSQKEIDYINKYDSYNNGYNSTLGGDGSRYIEQTDEEIIKKYFELKCMKLVANFYKISKDTVSLILHNNNVEIRDPRSVYVTIIELNMVFKTMSECADYLIVNNYTTCLDKQNIKTNIKRSIKRNGSYLKFTFKLDDSL